MRHSRRPIEKLVLAALLVLPSFAQVTQRASVASNGSRGTGIPNGSGAASISADGRYVSFSGQSTNFADGDTNGCADIFVRDRIGGTTERVSISTAGAQAN